MYKGPNKNYLSFALTSWDLGHRFVELTFRKHSSILRSALDESAEVNKFLELKFYEVWCIGAIQACDLGDLLIQVVRNVAYKLREAVTAINELFLDLTEGVPHRRFNSLKNLSVAVQRAVHR